jgi:hypothetical protein
MYDGLTLPVTATTWSRNKGLVNINLELPFRRIWSVTVQANDCQEHILAEEIELGRLNVIY